LPYGHTNEDLRFKHDRVLLDMKTNKKMKDKRPTEKEATKTEKEKQKVLDENKK